MDDPEHELDIDHALSQALTSAIASRAAGDASHALYLTSCVALYINTIFGVDTEEFTKVLQKVEESIDFSHVGASTHALAPPDEQDEVEVPQQNAPSSSTVN